MPPKRWWGTSLLMGAYIKAPHQLCFVSRTIPCFPPRLVRPQTLSTPLPPLASLPASICRSYLEQQALPLSSTQDGGGGSSSSSCVPLAVTAVAVDPHLYDTLVAADADGCVWQVQLQARGDPVVCVVAHVVADKVGVRESNKDAVSKTLWD